MSSRQAMGKRGPDHHPPTRRDVPAQMVTKRRIVVEQPDEDDSRPERRYTSRGRGRKRGSLFSRKWSKETSEWVFAGVVFVVLILAVVLGIHFVGGSNSAPTAAGGRLGTGGGGFSGFGGGQNTAIVSAVAGALGISSTTLTSDLQSGQTVAQIAAAQNVSITTVNSAYLVAVQQQFNTAVSSGRFTQAQADQLYSTQQQDVSSGQYPFLRVFGGPVATATQ
jgi:hypothetical protein